MKNFIKLLITAILASLIVFSAASCNFTSMLTQEPEETTQAETVEDNDSNDADDNNVADDNNDADDNDDDNGDLEGAVHNTFSDALCNTVNKSDILSMKMGTEGNNVLWELKLKKDVDDTKLKIVKDKMGKQNLPKNITSLRKYSGLPKDKQNCGLIVRYYTKDGKLFLEQKSK